MKFIKYLLSFFQCRHNNVGFPVKITGCLLTTQSCLDCGMVRAYELAGLKIGPWQRDVVKLPAKKPLVESWTGK